MATAAQITANQHNGWRSIGPKTEAGKEICSRNAVTHGLTAKRLLLSIEEQPEYDELHDSFIEAWAPKTAYERTLSEDTIRAYWFWSRAQRAHNAVLDALVKEERKADPKLTPEQALARLFTEDKNAKRLRLIMRYESAAERTYRKCKQELDSVIAARMRMETSRRSAPAMQSRETAEPPLPPAEIGSVSHIAPPPRR